MDDDHQRQRKQLATLLRSLADAIEKNEKTLGVVVAWVMQTEPDQMAHSAFSLHQKLGVGNQLNAWRAEASRIMGLMDVVDGQIKKAAGPPTVFN